MKIAVVGTGYVGLVTGVVFADLGNEVLCVDIDAAKVDAQGELTYESKPVAIQNPDTAYMEVFEKLVRELGVFPEGARLLSATVQNGTLQLNFSPELTQNFAGGSDDEAALINAITSTAGSFPNIERVQILVDGKPIESLGGHIDLSHALPVSR